MKSAATAICKALQKAGHTACFVGGAVRDAQRLIEPVDIDIATSATPDEVAQIFDRTKAVGKSFGVMLVDMNGHWIEVATFRTESEYTDGRRPDAISFSDMKGDAARRDFTINALYYDPVADVTYDFFDGISDLKRGVLRFIGEAETRVLEDHLRLLRAVRFAARFDLEYTPDTKASLSKHRSLIGQVSAERIGQELTKMLLHENRERALIDAMEFGFFAVLFPDFMEMPKTPQPPDHHAEGDVWAHSVLVAKALGGGVTPALVWAALLHDIGKTKTAHYAGGRIHFPDHAAVGASIAKQICKQLAFSKKMTHDVAWLVAHHELFDHWEAMRSSRHLFYFDHPLFESLLRLHRADIHGAIPTPPLSHTTALARLDIIQEAYYTAISEKRRPSDNPSILTGIDIMEALDLQPGKQIGVITNQAHIAQLEGLFTSREGAMKWLRAHFG